jgi:calcineurin-like phosphoesterase family protein
MGGKSVLPELRNILSKLNGKIILIRGNHDNYMLDDEVCVKRFDKIRDYMVVKVEGFKFVMFHFPMLTWEGAHHNNVVHMHGHSHGTLDYLNKNTRRMDIGVDTNLLKPYSFEEIYLKLKDVKYTPVDHHGANL